MAADCAAKKAINAGLSLRQVLESSGPGAEPGLNGGIWAWGELLWQISKRDFRENRPHKMETPDVASCMTPRKDQGSDLALVGFGART